jgi:hypothetical protein
MVRFLYSSFTTVDNILDHFLLKVPAPQIAPSHVLRTLIIIPQSFFLYGSVSIVSFVQGCPPSKRLGTRWRFTLWYRGNTPWYEFLEGMKLWFESFHHWLIQQQYDIIINTTASLIGKEAFALGAFPQQTCALTVNTLWRQAVRCKR